MTDATNNPPRCLQCERTGDEVPLMKLQYRGDELWICPQHLPLLIHSPIKLVGRLPGAETLEPFEE